MNMEVTKRLEFECCYVYRKEIHAHRYKLEVTVEGPQRFDDYGVVISFDELLKYMKEIVPDKTFIYFVKDNDGVSISNAFGDCNYPTLGFNDPISAETLCKYLAFSLQDKLNILEPGINIIDLKLREDSNSFVSWKPGCIFSGKKI